MFDLKHRPPFHRALIGNFDPFFILCGRGWPYRHVYAGDAVSDTKMWLGLSAKLWEVFFGNGDRYFAPGCVLGGRGAGAWQRKRARADYACREDDVGIASGKTTGGQVIAGVMLIYGVNASVVRAMWTEKIHKEKFPPYIHSWIQCAHAQTDKAKYKKRAYINTFMYTHLHTHLHTHTHTGPW